MSKLRLQLSSSNHFDISLGFFTLSQMIRVLQLVALGSLALFLVSLPFAGIAGFSFEEVYLYLLLQLVLVLVVSIAALIALRGFKQLRDVPQFLTVLVFAFLAISTYLLAPAAETNTFGLADLRYLSGLAVMIFLTVFYAGSLVINTERSWSGLATILLILPMLVVFISLFPAELELTSGWPVGFANVFLLFMPSLFFTILLARQNWLKLAAVVSILLAAFSLWQYSSWQVWLGIFLASAATLWSAFVVSKQNIFAGVGKLSQQAQDFLAGKLALKTWLREVFPLKIVATSVVLLIAAVIVILQREVDLISYWDILSGDLERILVGIEIPTLLFGSGTSLAAATSVATTATAILQMQGVLGLLAYGILALSGFSLAFYSLGQGLNKYKFELGMALAPILFAVPLLGLFTRLSLVIVIVWWFTYTLLAVIKSFPVEQIAAVHELNILGRDLSRYLPWLRAALILALIAVWIFVSRELWFSFAAGNIFA